MNANAASDRDRLLELLADQVIGKLDPAEEQELRELRKIHPDIAADDLDQAAALFELASLPADMAFLPDEVRNNVLSSSLATEYESDSLVTPARDEYSGSRFREWLGWMVAAGLLIAILWSSGPPPVPQLSVAAQRNHLAQVADVVTISWTKTADKSALNASGDVMWSNSLQQGYLRFVGLEVNDPAQQQYQLWIIDAGRPGSDPVDGGVFDITESGEVLIPINAKLRVFRPATFAVTIEKPGGVVVSKQERVPLLAQAEEA